MDPYLLQSRLITHQLMIRTWDRENKGQREVERGADFQPLPPERKLEEREGTRWYHLLDEDRQLEIVPTRGECVWATPDMDSLCPSLYHMIFITTLDPKKQRAGGQIGQRYSNKLSPAS